MKYIQAIQALLIFVVGSSAISTLGDKIQQDDELGKGFLDFFWGIRPRFCKCVCGKVIHSAGATTKIIGGSFISAHEFPWLVVINIQSTSTATGTLISDRYVLTSASQVIGLTPYDLKITVGAYDRCFPGVTSSNVSVSNIAVHPEFDLLARNNDLALLKLTVPIIADRWTAPICLPKPGAIYDGHTVQMVGWGEGPTEEGAQVTTCLPRMVEYPVISSKQCLYRVTDVGTVTADKGCVSTGAKQTAICSTDAGAPVQTRGLDGYYELVGVLPDTNICSTEGSGVTLFTRLNQHYTWLFESTKDGCYCSK